MAEESEAQETEAPETGTEESAPVRDRQCGRCRRVVPGDPAQHAVAQLGWWLCPSCKEALVGHQRQPRS